MFLRDFIIGLHTLLPVVYASFAVIVFIGFQLRNKRSAFRVGSATISGSIQLRANLDNKVELQGEVTFQERQYENKVYWSSDIDGTKDFLKSPDFKGFFAVDLYMLGPLKLSLNGVLT